jgi:hypothetical protein
VTPITYVENQSFRNALISTIKRLIDNDPRLHERVVYDNRRDYLQSLLSHPLHNWLPVLPDVPEHVLGRTRSLSAESEKPAPSVWERLIRSAL